MYSEESTPQFRSLRGHAVFNSMLSGRSLLPLPCSLGQIFCNVVVKHIVFTLMGQGLLRSLSRMNIRNSPQRLIFLLKKTKRKCYVPGRPYLLDSRTSWFPLEASGLNIKSCWSEGLGWQLCDWWCSGTGLCHAGLCHASGMTLEDGHRTSL